MNKSGFFLFSFLFYLFIITLTCSILIPFIYKASEYLFLLAHKTRECNRAENAFQALYRDVQKINSIDTIDFSSYVLSFEYKNNLVTWFILNNNLYRKESENKRIVLQNVLTLDVEKYINYITVIVRTKEETFRQNFYTYAGIAL